MMTRRWCARLVAGLLAYSTVSAQTPLRVPQAITSETLTISTTAVGLAAGTITPADGKGVVQFCRGRLEAQPIRTGTAATPTATVGTTVYADEIVTLTGYRAITAWKAIRHSTATADATLTMECWREYKP